MTTAAIIKRMAKRAADYREQFAGIIGRMIEDDSCQRWQLADFNDLGVPYWRKPGQEKLFTLSNGFHHLNRIINGERT